MIIRPETPDDVAAIGEVVTAAFGQPMEAELVARLRSDGDLTLSLVAEDEGAIAGHVAFSRLWIEDARGRAPGISLAPVAVLPVQQRKGVGRALIGAGHLRLKALGETIVFVLGDPDYYKRFGFSREAAEAFRCAYQGDYLQALQLSPDAPTAGEVIYAPAFAAVG
ncbi:N-acetyltransferase [Bradyrhizobium sp. LHD-71]|uniref:GNAT family N-acetyltransferase n=1 Tax=Bradyrhizobium sp. LHD-71 TaxID=3072141 RepID=UPI00280C943B|nr:N-acetyltransferase [Bradyrhizobium sp. LHD-71]MDQ8727260.1 N-acetyltransferase [Bradyrhizobium sp. LHD-71]